MTEPESASEMKGDRAAVRIACVSDTSATSAALVETIGALLPGVGVRALESSVERGVPDTDAVIVDVSGRGASRLDVIRQLRAKGYAGGIVLVADPVDEELRMGAGRIGARVVARGGLLEDLPDALTGALAAGGALLAPMRRLQQLIAAGQMAIRLQHAINNPLAALLAEAQLLELEPLDEEHLEAAHRMVEQIRRVIDLVRQLDGVGSAPTPTRVGAVEPGYDSKA